jgi:hypothetical protein
MLESMDDCLFGIAIVLPAAPVDPKVLPIPADIRKSEGKRKEAPAFSSERETQPHVHTRSDR